LASMFALTQVLLAPGPLEARSSKASYKVLYSFQGQPDGAGSTGVIVDASGTLYGTTTDGGTGTCTNDYNPGCGTVFAVDSGGQETLLYSFTGYKTDGDFPVASLVRDSSGNLYGTTSEGGAHNVGTVFKVDTSGTETVLYSFCPGGFPCTADGMYPHAGVILDAQGNLYGTTHQSGPADYGTVFKVDSNGAETVLYAFTGSTDGAHPQANLIFDAAGNLYGTTSGGGAGCNGAGCGVVFKLDASGKETVLHSFKDVPDGASPLGGLIWDSQGNLYGTTLTGGHKYRYCQGSGCGTIFKLAPTGKETVLYRFPRLSTGVWPEGALVRDSSGNLYGTTSWGGDTRYCAIGCGVVFKLSKTGKETLLYKFTSLPTHGGGSRYPAATLVRDLSGNLYGTTELGGTGDCKDPGGIVVGCGVVFKLTP